MSAWRFAIMFMKTEDLTNFAIMLLKSKRVTHTNPQALSVCHYVAEKAWVRPGVRPGPLVCCSSAAMGGPALTFAFCALPFDLGLSAIPNLAYPAD
jgi:hypothetical protein